MFNKNYNDMIDNYERRRIDPYNRDRRTFNENNYTVCLSCNKTINNCFTCFGDLGCVACSSCFPKFKLEENKCVNYIKKKCLIGEKEKWKECEENEELMDKCKYCNEGYYLSDNTNKTECQSCNIIDKCIEYNEENKNLILRKMSKWFYSFK